MIRSLRFSLLPLSQSIRYPLGFYPTAFISTTAICRAGLIQDLYLKELKAYKPPIIKTLDSVGHVQKFTPPKSPQPPNEGDIANELKEYETQQVEVEGQATEGEISEVEADWFEEPLEEKAPSAH